MKKLALAAACATLAVLPGHAADLGRVPRGPVPAAAYVPPPMLWNGFYLGAHLGYGWGHSGANFLGASLAPTPRPSGIFGGGQIGYNFQFSPNWVFGLEADISGADLSDSVTVGGFTGRSQLNVFGTVRGRIGYAFNNVLIYGTGGFAWGQNRLSVSPIPAGVGSASRFHTGYAVGGGVEYAFTPNWSVKAEYMYLDLGRRDYGFGLGAPVRFRTDTHTVKLGVNYRFNFGGPYVPGY